MTSDLLPCPFCEGKAVMNGDDHSLHKCCRAHCTTCSASTGRYFNTRDEATAAWNRRAAPPAETGEVVMGFVVKGFGRSPRDIEMDRGPLRNIANRMEEGDRVRFRLLPIVSGTPVDPPTGECERCGNLRWVNRTEDTSDTTTTMTAVPCPDCSGRCDDPDDCPTYYDGCRCVEARRDGPERIYLEPPPGSPDTGRMWCEDDQSEDDRLWVPYVRADLVGGSGDGEGDWWPLTVDDDDAGTVRCEAITSHDRIWSVWLTPGNYRVSRTPTGDAPGGET